MQKVELNHECFKQNVSSVDTTTSVSSQPKKAMKQSANKNSTEKKDSTDNSASEPHGGGTKTELGDVSRSLSRKSLKWTDILMLL